MSNIIHFFFGSFSLMMSPIWKQGRGRNWIIATVAVATVAVGATALGPGIPIIPDSGTTANIWVDTNGGTCSDSISMVSYTDSGSCVSLAAAVTIAEPGDTIRIRAGDYPFETLAYRSNLQNLSLGCDPYGTWGSISTSNCIHIQPDGGNVYIRGLVNNASSIWLQGNVTGIGGAGAGNPQNFLARTYDFHITRNDLIGNPPAGAATDAYCNCASAQFRVARPAVTSNTTQRPDHVIADGIDSDTVDVYSASNVLIKNSDVGPLWVDTSVRGDSSGSSPDIPRIWATGSAGVATNINIESTFFHDINRTWWCDFNNACHPDGLYIKNGGPITIKHSAFSKISGEVLFFENFNGEAPDTNNFTMENTWLGCKVNSYPDNPSGYLSSCGSGAPIDFKNCGSSGCINFLLRYNSWYSIEGAETDFTNVRFVGNAGEQPNGSASFCSAATWTYNAFYTKAIGGSNCGATNTNTGSTSPLSLFVSTSLVSENYHLAGSVGSTVADNFVTPTTSDYILTMDADGELRTNGNRDAGSDER